MTANDDRKRVGYARKAARQTVEDYFRAHLPHCYPVPVEMIAESLGFEIYSLDSLEQGHRAMKVEIPSEGRKLIGVGSNYHLHNRRFSVAHEIGHHVMGHAPEDDCTDEEIALYNREADEFAGELLIPLSELKICLEKKMSVKSIAAHFLVSEEALWIKMSHQNLLGRIVSR
jgi:Zn-dependent peptidase ImmA (M78 family)